MAETLVTTAVLQNLAQVYGHPIRYLKGLQRKFEQLKPAKRHERKVEELKQKVDLLENVGVKMERKKIDQLLLGVMPTVECKTWIAMAERILFEVHTIIKDKGKDSDIVIFHRRADKQLKMMLGKITDHLEEYNGMMTDAVNVTKNDAAGKVEMMPTRLGGVDELPIAAKSKGKVTGSRYKEASEIINLPPQNYMSVDGASKAAAETGYEITPLLRTKTLPVYGTGFQFNSADQETKNKTGIQFNPADVRETEEETGIQYNPSDVLVRKLETGIRSNPANVLETEIETVFQSSAADVEETEIEIVIQSNPAEVLETEIETGFQSNAADIQETEIETGIQSSHADVLETETETEIQSNAADVLETKTGIQSNPADVQETEIETEVQSNPADVLTTEIKAGIQSNPAGVLETEIVEINPDANLGMASSHDMEIEPLLFEGEEEGQMKPELVSSINASLKPEIVPSFYRYEKKSRRSIDDNVKEIIGLLRDDKFRRIGIYGTGGVGKTSILKSLFNATEAKNMFDSIIWITVSRHWSTKKIWDQVEMQLLTSPLASSTNPQPILSHSLRNKKLLFLLDDVWDWIDLDAAGIPVPILNQETGCRIILTSRSLDVCRIMDADKELEIKPISREEARELFYDQVGGIVNSTDIKLYAEPIVVECGGLPLTIIVIGRALRKENDVLVWKHALKELLSHGSEAVVRKLKFSYDQLKARDVKDCFLYCASFQEDHEVSISQLLNYLVDEGLVAGNMEDAFRRGNDIIQTLIEASMLESTSDGASVKMHDVLRDLASTLMLPGAEGCHFLVRADFRLTQQVQSPKRNAFMTDKGHQFLFGAGAGSIEPPSNKKWEQAVMIFLMDNELFSLPESPSCPNLLCLFLQRNNHLRAIPESFFDRMPCLEVLNLSQTKIKSLPQSLFKLKGLKALIIRDCKHFSILPPAIGALETLELLDLRGTAIYNLPDDVQSLARLKHMIISFYGSNNSSEYSKLPQTLVSNGILSRLVHLTVLHITVYPGDQRWSKSIKFITMEIQNLNELEMLEIHFPEVELLEQFLRDSQPWNDQRLTKFRFVVGHNVKRVVERVPDDVELDYDQQDRRLIFVNEETLPSAVKEVLSCSTAFYLDHHLNICKLSDFGVINLNALKFLILRECPAMQTVLNGKEVEGSAFPLLEHFSIHLLWSLEKICENPVPTGSFSKLRYLSIHTCPVLPFVLPCSMAQNLHNLEVLIVEDCEAVKELIYKDKSFAPGEILLPSLKKLRLHYLPNLVGIWKGSWPPIEHISFYDCPNLKNLHMSFNVIDTIKEIKAEKEWWDDLTWDDYKLFEQLRVCYTELCYDDL